MLAALALAAACEVGGPQAAESTRVTFEPRAAAPTADAASTADESTAASADEPARGGAPEDRVPIARIARVVPAGAGPAATGDQDTAVPLLECPRRVLFQGRPLVTFECTLSNFGAAGTVVWQLAHESGGVEITPREGEAVDMTV